MSGELFTLLIRNIIFFSTSYHCHSRLDYFFIPKTDLHLVLSCTIQSILLSDHTSVTMELQFRNTVDSGDLILQPSETVHFQFTFLLNLNIFYLLILYPQIIHLYYGKLVKFMQGG